MKKAEVERQLELLWNGQDALERRMKVLEKRTLQAEDQLANTDTQETPPEDVIQLGEALHRSRNQKIVKSRIEEDLDLKKMIIRKHNLDLIKSLLVRFRHLFNGPIQIPDNTPIDEVVGVFIGRAYAEGRKNENESIASELAAYLVEDWGHLPDCDVVKTTSTTTISNLVKHFMEAAIKEGRAEKKTLTKAGVCEELQMLFMSRLERGGYSTNGPIMRIFNKAMKSVCGEETKGEEGKDETPLKKEAYEELLTEFMGELHGREIDSRILRALDRAMENIRKGKTEGEEGKDETPMHC